MNINMWAVIGANGELVLLEFSLAAGRCTACDARGATMTMVRLCDFGCTRRR